MKSPGSEKTSISTIMNTYRLNAACNSEPDGSYFLLDQEAGLHDWASAYLPGFPDDKDKEIRNYWAINTSQPVHEWENLTASNLANDGSFFTQQEETSLRDGTSANIANFPFVKEGLNYDTKGICQPTQECGKSFIEPVVENSNTHDYLGAPTWPLNVPTQIQNFNSFSLDPQSLSEEYTTKIDASSLNAFYDNDKGLPDSNQAKEKRILYNTNVPTTMGNNEHRDLLLKHRVEDQQTFSGSYKAQNKILSEIAFQDCGAGRNEPQNITKILISSTNAESFGSSSGVHPCRQKKIGTFICKDCGKRFGARYNLVVHYRTHTGEKPFTCNVCGRAFCQKGTLTTHIRIHTREKPFACKECGQKFSAKASLKNHIWIHTKEKPFSCDECGRSFSLKGNLTTHIRIHTKEKRFVCKECGKSFSQRGHLTSHIRIHTGEKPFACKDCGRSFSHKSSLKNHIQIHTKEKLCL